jgi:hypothetical protein
MEGKTMDPNKTLADFREAVKAARRPDTTEEARAWNAALAMQAAEALDDWISRGGVLPSAWDRTLKGPHSIHTPRG